MFFPMILEVRGEAEECYWQDQVFHAVNVRCRAPGATSAPATFPGL